MKRLSIFLLIVTICIVSVFSQTEDSLFFTVDLPLSQFPYNLQTGYTAASMDQAVNLTKNLYYSTHFGIELFSRKHLGKNSKTWGRVIMTIFDFAPIPLSNTWLHEEYHRAILSLREIKSKNSHWTNSVKGVDDHDLINLKLLHPADMVREATAGNEGNLEFVHSVQKDVFYDHVNTWNYGLYWGNATYDLFNPQLAYEDRGIHPSGHGIDRYVEFDDLSSDAQQFLKNQFYLSLLNFVDINLFGIDHLGTKVKYNFSLRHHMTSFGQMVGANLLFKTEKIGGSVHPKIFQNNQQSLLGLDLELRNNWGVIKLSGWQQPIDQLYYDTKKRTGGMVGLKLVPPLKKIRPYLDLNFKSKGWVAGNPYLDKNFTIVFGARMLVNSKSNLDKRGR